MLAESFCAAVCLAVPEDNIISQEHGRQTFEPSSVRPEWNFIKVKVLFLDLLERSWKRALSVKVNGGI